MKLVHSENTPFSLSDWMLKGVSRVYAGLGCAMAVTRKGTVLQKVSDPSLAAKTEYWKNIRAISISNCHPALAVGLVDDGTLMLSKGAARAACAVGGVSFEEVNRALKELKDIVQVCVSDAIFALDRVGRVHCIPLDSRLRYENVADWRGVSRIAVGNQCAVFAVTRDGSVLCDGHNCLYGPHGDMREKLSSYKDVKGVCPMGSECESVLLAMADGTVLDPWDRWEPFRVGDSAPDLCGNFRLAAAYGEKGTRFVSYSGPCADDLKKLEKERFSQVAVGLTEDYQPFVIALRA